MVNKDLQGACMSMVFSRIVTFILACFLICLFENNFCSSGLNEFLFVCVFSPLEPEVLVSLWLSMRLQIAAG